MLDFRGITYVDIKAAALNHAGPAKPGSDAMHSWGTYIPDQATSVERHLSSCYGSLSRGSHFLTTGGC